MLDLQVLVLHFFSQEKYYKSLNLIENNYFYVIQQGIESMVLLNLLLLLLNNTHVQTVFTK